MGFIQVYERVPKIIGGPHHGTSVRGRGFFPEQEHRGAVLR